MNLRKNQKGFTIVELLIVVVVIAILAAISIVAYTGITNRANASAAAEAANSVKSVASAFQGSQSEYPDTKLEFVNGIVAGSTEPALAKLPSDITFLTTTSALAATNIQASGITNPKTVAVVPHGSPIAGFTIYYKDFNGTTAKSTTVGDTSAAAATNAIPNA